MTAKTRKAVSWIPLGLSLLTILALFYYARAEQQRREAATRRAETYFSFLYDGALPVAVVGPNQQIVEWNPAASRKYGFSSAEVLGKSPQEVFGSWWEYYSGAAERAEAYDMRHTYWIEGTVRTASGTETPQRILARPVVNGHGIFHVIVCFDPPSSSG